MAVVRIVLRLHCSCSSPCALPDFVNGVENMKRSEIRRKEITEGGRERERENNQFRENLAASVSFS